MFWNPFNIILLTLWLLTLAAFVLYRQGRKKRHQKTLEKHLSERDQTFLRLRQSEERYEKLISHMNEGLIFTDDKDKIRFVNKCSCSILKTTSRQILGRSILEFVLSPMEAKKLGLPYELKRPGCSHREEVQMVRGNGEMFWASLNISYLDSLHDHMPGAIIVMTDITEQKKSEERLHNLTISLNQKVQQLDCLFDISDITNVPGISFDGIFERSLEVIPFGLKFPHDVWVEIRFGDRRYASKNHQESRWSYSVPIKGQNKKIGTLTVGYLENKPLVNKDPFHINEKILVKNIAEKLGQVIEIKQMETTLNAGLKRLDQVRDMARIGEWEWDIPRNRFRFSRGFFEVVGVPAASRRHYSFQQFIAQVSKEDLPAMESFTAELRNGSPGEKTWVFHISTHSGQEKLLFSNGTLVKAGGNGERHYAGILQDLGWQLKKSGLDVTQIS
jgi:PAS domain S-box-containing protein